MTWKRAKGIRYNCFSILSEMLLKDGKESFLPYELQVFRNICVHSWNHFVAFAKTETFRLHVSLNSLSLHDLCLQQRILFEVFVENFIEEFG
jgi:hypothetical protein